MLIAYDMACATSRVAAHSPGLADTRLVVDGDGDGWFSDASNREGRAAHKSKGIQFTGRCGIAVQHQYQATPQIHWRVPCTWSERSNVLHALD
jgi:hypothetical protein